MKHNYIAIGEGLGKFPNFQGEINFRVKSLNTINLDEFSYSLWEILKTQPKKIRNLLIESSNKDNGIINQTIRNLIKLGLVIEVTNANLEKIIKQFALIPKGFAGKQNENIHSLICFPGHDPFEIPVIPFLVWFHAHPFIPIIDVLNAVNKDSGISMDNIEKDFMEWLPILISYDVISLIPINWEN